MLPETRGKTYILRILSVYNELYFDKYGRKPFIVFGKFGSLVKQLIDHYTELQIAAMLITFFNWRGMEGDDGFSEQKIINAIHNFGWFFSTVNSYEVYLCNVHGLDFDNEDEVRNFVEKSLQDLRK